MTPPRDAMNVHEPKPLQFSLRTLLIAMSACPALLAAAVQFQSVWGRIALCVVLGSLAVGCFKFAWRLAIGEASWHGFAAVAMTVAGVSMAMLLLVNILLTFVTALLLL